MRGAAVTAFHHCGARLATLEAWEPDDLVWAGAWLDGDDDLTSVRELPEFAVVRRRILLAT